MIDFSTLQGLTIPEGVVTQIADASGRVIWAVQNSAPVVLQVEKITSDTYAGETTYTGEQFILLDIYPKTSGTVKVTYGGLTKTITDTSGAAEPNAQQVFFGTFNGVSDEVETPASGTLTIEGGFYAFGRSVFSTSSKGIKPYDGIIAVSDYGNITNIPLSAFARCSKLIVQEIPEGIEKIGDMAFAMYAWVSSIVGGTEMNLYWETAMEAATIILPSTIKSIGSRAFTSTTALSNSSGGTADIYPCYFAKVKILATTPPTLGEAAFGDRFRFNNETNAYVKIFEVPKGCGDIYKAAEGWSSYVSNITEAE